MTQSARAAVLLADGFEEIEALTIIDVLRRADVHVDVLAVKAKRVTGAHGVVVEADALLSTHAGERYAMVVLPGGMPGASTLRDDAGVQAFVKAHRGHDAWLGAICAGPIALAQAGVLAGKRATCFPGFEDQLGGAAFEESAVVQDGRVITSRGVGTALPFALALVAALRDRGFADTLAKRMLISA